MTTGAGGEAGPVVGGRYLLAEDDYRFGLGPLLIRVLRVIAPVEFGDGGRAELWWQVDATCKPPNHAGAGQPRSLYVRAGCLTHARRAARRLPG